MIRRRLRRDVRGSTTVEFAVVGWMLCMMTFGIVETGLLWWLKSGMQVTAALTARCGAIGYDYGTSNCTTTTSTQNYAVSTAQFWLFPNVIVANNVTVNTLVSGAACGGAPGTFFKVSIISNYFQFLPPPLGNYASLSTSACFPMQ
jgi:hypothetical protein